MTKAYILLADRFEHKAGTIIYKCTMYDYGLRRDDENFTGLPHLSMTLNSTGDYPSFTVPEHLVRVANAEDLLKSQGYILEKEDEHGKVFTKEIKY